MDKRLFILLALLRTLINSRIKAAESDGDADKVEKYTILLAVIETGADLLGGGQ